MSRRVVTVEYQATTAVPAAKIDTYFDRVVKYIPSDIVGAWVAVTGMIHDANNVPRGKVLWICFVVGAVLTFLWTLKQTAVPGKPPAYVQAWISTGAFVVWAFALVGGPLESFPSYRHLYGSLLLVLYTFLVPLIDPGQ